MIKTVPWLYCGRDIVDISLYNDLIEHLSVNLHSNNGLGYAPDPPDSWKKEVVGEH
jgi:hypothetical protein